MKIPMVLLVSASSLKFYYKKMNKTYSIMKLI